MQFPVLTNTQKGCVYASYNSPLCFWDGVGGNGYPKDTKLKGDNNNKPTDGYTLPIIGYTANRPVNAIITGEKWVDATGANV